MIHTQKFTKKCKACDEEFTKPYNISRASWHGDDRRPNGVQFCSINCRNKHLIGRTAPNKGTSGLIKWDEKRRMAAQILWHEKRESSDNYKFSGTKWGNVRKHVLVRDNYECQDCGFTEKAIMQVDHILPKSTHPELMYKSENCITLCPNCHARKTVSEKSELLLAARKRKTTIAPA